MSESFAGKSVVVTGGTGGLGRSVSLAFLEAGAFVSVTYRDSAELAALQKEASANASKLDAYSTDVTEDSAVAALFESVVAKRGRVDALVNTVGGYIGGVKLWELDAKGLDRMLTLNLRAGFTLARNVAPRMMKQGAGAIVNVAAKAAFDHGAGASAYAASKAAAVAMMDSMAEDLRGSGVRVNTILPSIIDTPVNRQAMPKADFSKWPKPEDIARVILFLSSEDAKVIHGAAIPVYGGK